MPKAKSSAVPDFEQALAELEALVEKLESGDLPLEDALKQFERGIELTRICKKSLKDAELKVERLLEKNGEESLVPLDPDTDQD